MPLSEEELRLLEQMERALVEEDPKFASTLRGTTMRRNARRRALVAGLAFAAGVTILMAGAVTQRAYVGIIGFVLMLGSAYVALSAMRGPHSSTTVPDDARSAHPSGFTVHDGGKKTHHRPGRSARRTQRRSHGSFMERMEERWRRRRETGGF